MGQRPVVQLKASVPEIIPAQSQKYKNHRQAPCVKTAIPSFVRSEGTLPSSSNLHIPEQQSKSQPYPSFVDFGEISEIPFTFHSPVHFPAAVSSRASPNHNIDTPASSSAQGSHRSVLLLDTPNVLAVILDAYSHDTFRPDYADLWSIDCPVLPHSSPECIPSDGQSSWLENPFGVNANLQPRLRLENNINHDRSHPQIIRDTAQVRVAGVSESSNHDTSEYSNPITSFSKGLDYLPINLASQEGVTHLTSAMLGVDDSAGVDWNKFFHNACTTMMNISKNGQHNITMPQVNDEMKAGGSKHLGV